MRRLASSLIAAALAFFAHLSPFTPFASRVHAQLTPTFSPTGCTTMLAPKTDNPLNALLPAADERMHCGYVTVPETHDANDGRTLQIAVVVLKATGKDLLADPLFLLQGGPGGGTIDTYQARLRSHAIRERRDIVLFDQRGTGRSQPLLRCTEPYDADVRTAEQRLSFEESTRISEEAIAQCRERLTREGVRLDAFDSVENARDIDDVRRALGYQKINLYGVSYGSQLAQHAMRVTPDSLRTVILDAVAPLAGSFVMDVSKSENRALTEFFTACADDSICSRDYPNLEARYFELVAQLDAAPLRVRVDDPNTGRTYQAWLDGQTLQDMFFQTLYSAEILPLLPRLIEDLRAGDTGFAGNILSLFAFDQSVALGMYFSVICAEDVDFDPRSIDTSKIRPQIAEHAVDEAESLLRMCRNWNVSALPSIVNQPVRSAVPTLVLNGRFDPITPPSNGVDAAAELSTSYVFTFSNSAHGAFPMNNCADGVMQAFLAQPNRRPDDTCVREGAAIAFVGKDAIINVPVLGQLLNAPSAARQWEFLALIAALLTLLSGLILLPLGWLVRMLFKRNSRLPMSFATRAMPWAVMLYLVGLLVFIGGLFGAAIMSASEGEYAFLVGVTSDIRPLFTLPPVLAMLAAIVTWGVVSAWRGKAWGISRRIYRSILALATIAGVVVLLRWDLLLP